MSESGPPQFPKKEITPAQIESLMDAKVEPKVLMADLLDHIKTGDSYATFVVLSLEGGEYGLRMSIYGHNMLYRSLHVHRDECLISDGNFRVNRETQNLEFLYLIPHTHDKKVEEAVENKIQAFLRSHGISFRKVVYPKG